MKRFFIPAFVACATVATLAAQEKVSPVAFQFGAGFTQGVGRTGENLNTGWNTFGGVGYNFNNHFAAMIDISTNVFGIANTIPQNFGVRDGHLTILSATLDPVVHLMPGGHVDAYVTGGGGLYHRGFTPSGPSGANSVPDYYSVNKPGVDVGMGLAFGTKWRGKVFVEARYNHIFDNNHYFANYLPVTFGYRW